MKSSRFYQTSVQVVGSVAEIILFLSGFFLGKEMFGTAFIFLIIRMIHKVIMSELMFRRAKSVIREGINDKPNSKPVRGDVPRV